eukprot:29216-Pelagococcus_subviridis.AAC.1
MDAFGQKLIIRSRRHALRRFHRRPQFRIDRDHDRRAPRAQLRVPLVAPRVRRVLPTPRALGPRRAPHADDDPPGSLRAASDDLRGARRRSIALQSGHVELGDGADAVAAARVRNLRLVGHDGHLGDERDAFQVVRRSGEALGERRVRRVHRRGRLGVEGPYER